MVHILLIEDHPLFRDGFAAMLARHRPDWRLSTAATAAAAMTLLRCGSGGAASAAAAPDVAPDLAPELAPNLAPDLAIVDIVLPDSDGFATMRAIGTHLPTLPLIAISGREDEAARLRSRDCGAAAFIAKAWPAEQIVQTIARVLDGATPYAAAPTATGLTPRQLEVLAMLAEGHSNKAIEARLGIAARTVRSHLTEIFDVLNVSGRLQATLKARELGLIP